MSKRRLRNAGRQKALFGSEAAAVLAAAGINVAGTMAASAISANATKKAAQDQAKATIQSAQRQSQAIKDQTAKSREYQMEAQEFTKEQNAENRELQKDIQMQLQMLTGAQNVNDRFEASKTKVKAGGKTRKLGLPTSLLRGGNMPFQVTDGGGVIPVGRTPEGFDLYEIVGNDHEHYHKTRQLKTGGKYKSGVGIKFADGNIVEGEGNQNTNQGELMLVTPDNAYFISKHSINGFNPAKMVEQGIHPIEAFNIQEKAKAIAGINDDGTKAKYGKKRFLIGGTPNLYDYAMQLNPQVGTDTVGDTAVGVAYATKNSADKRLLRCGGKVRHKAVGGTVINNWWNNLNNNTKHNIGLAASGVGTPTVRGGSSTTTNFSNYKVTPEKTFTHQRKNTSNRTNPYNTNRSKTSGSWVSRNADLIGAGINAIGNVGGALITSNANLAASRTLSDAYSKGADIMAEAYRNLQTIDMNSLRKEDYRAAHMMPALQAPVSFAASNIAGVDRSLQRRLRNAGRYSASSAAAQERMANAEVEAQDQRNRIYSADQQQMQEIRQKNAERVTEASRVNAMLDTEANKQFGQDYLKLLQYNNDIENQRILGSAGALSEGAINGASAISQGQTSSAQAWATALANSGLTFSNTLSSMAKRRADLESVMLGSTMGGRVNYLAKNGTKAEKDRQKAALQQAIRTENLSPEDRATYEYYIKLLS